MSLSPPPIQEQTTDNVGLFPLTWKRWFEDIVTFLNDIFSLKPQILAASSTGWLSGGVISENAQDNSKFDYTSGSGFITDASDPTKITTQVIEFEGRQGVELDFLATDPLTFMSINSDKELVQSLGFPVNGDLRQLIQLGAVGHANNVNINSISNFTSAPPFQIAPSLTDLQTAIGVIHVNGNIFSGSGNGDLTFKKTAGRDFYLGIQPKEYAENPNNIDNVEAISPDIVFSWRDGSGGFNTSVAKPITAGVYDDGTGGVSAPSGTLTTNRWTNVRIKYSPDADSIVIEYGDGSYNSPSSALLSIGSDFYGDNPAYVGVPIRSYLSIRGAASNLDVSGDGVFTQTNKFSLL